MKSRKTTISIRYKLAPETPVAGAIEAPPRSAQNRALEIVAWENAGEKRPN